MERPVSERAIVVLLRVSLEVLICCEHLPEIYWIWANKTEASFSSWRLLNPDLALKPEFITAFWFRRLNIHPIRICVMSLILLWKKDVCFWHIRLIVFGAFYVFVKCVLVFSKDFEFSMRFYFLLVACTCVISWFRANFMWFSFCFGLIWPGQIV